MLHAKTHLGELGNWRFRFGEAADAKEPLIYNQVQVHRDFKLVKNLLTPYDRVKGASD